MAALRHQVVPIKMQKNRVFNRCFTWFSWPSLNWFHSLTSCRDEPRTVTKTRLPRRRSCQPRSCSSSNSSSSSSSSSSISISSSSSSISSSSSSTKPEASVPKCHNWRTCSRAAVVSANPRPRPPSRPLRLRCPRTNRNRTRFALCLLVCLFVFYRLLPRFPRYSTVFFAGSPARIDSSPVCFWLNRVDHFPAAELRSREVLKFTDMSWMRMTWNASLFHH